MPPAPGNAASGDTATKPAEIAGGRVFIRCRCSVEGIFWVAAIQAFDRARPSPPAPPSSIREAVTSAPDAPTTAMAPEMPSCSALSTAATDQLARAGEPPGDLDVRRCHAPTMLKPPSATM